MYNRHPSSERDRTSSGDTRALGPALRRSSRNGHLVTLDLKSTIRCIIAILSLKACAIEVSFGRFSHFSLVSLVSPAWIIRETRLYRIKRSPRQRSRRRTADPIRFLLSGERLRSKNRPRNLLFSPQLPSNRAILVWERSSRYPSDERMYLRFLIKTCIPL